MNIEALFEAKSVAVVGASEKGIQTPRLLENLASSGFDADRVYLVNPRRSVVLGRPCFPTLSELPEVPALVVLLVGPERAVEVAEEAAQLGVRSLVTVSGGFAESDPDGQRRQQALLEVAERSGMALLGPNTFGFVSPSKGIGAWSGGVLPPLVPGGLGVVTQSSGMLNLVLPLLSYRGIGLASAVSVGNEAMVDAGDALQHLADDPATEAVALILEGTTRPRRLAQGMAAIRDSGKTLMVLKFGNSEIGRKNALSHSGRLGSSARSWETLFRRVSAAVATDLDELINMAAVVPSVRARLLGAGVAFVTNSGGDCGLFGDLAEAAGVGLAPLGEDTLTQLRELSGAENVVGSPLDVGLFGTEGSRVRTEAIEAVVADPGTSMVVARLALPWTFDSRAAATYEQMAELCRTHGKRLAVASRACEPFEQAWFDHFREHDIPFLVSYASALRACGTLAHAAGLGSQDWQAESLPELATGDSPQGGGALDWGDTQEWLAKAHVPHVSARLAPDALQAGAAARELGFPVAVKAVCFGLAHKAEVGGVRLGLASEEAVVRACAGMKADFDAGARTIDGFEVQRMVDDPRAEMLLGMVRDEVLGPLVTFGWGGAGVESMQDVTWVMPPVRAAEVVELLGQLRFGRELTRLGVTDLGTIGRVVEAFSRAVVESGAGVSAIDLNPLMIDAQGGVTAVDAYISTSPLGPSQVLQ